MFELGGDHCGMINPCDSELIFLLMQSKFCELFSQECYTVGYIRSASTKLPSTDQTDSGNDVHSGLATQSQQELYFYRRHYIGKD